MSLNKLKSRGLSTITSVSVVSTFSSPICASALNFPESGWDEGKKVYYLGSGEERKEFKSVLNFVFAFLGKIFAFDKKVKEEESNKNDKDISTPDETLEESVNVNEELSPEDSADVYKSVKEIMEKLSKEYVLESEKWMPIEWDENFKSNNGSYSCYFCTQNRHESCKRNLYKSTRVAKVTIDEEKLTVDYTVSGLNKVVAVNLSEKDSLKKATDLLESIRSHKQSLRGIDDLKWKGAAVFNKEDGSVKVCADNGEEWRFYSNGYKKYSVIKEIVINRYSFVTLRYKDGEEVSYDLTKVEDAKGLQNVFEYSYFTELPKDNSYRIEHSNFTM